MKILGAFDDSLLMPWNHVSGKTRKEDIFSSHLETLTGFLPEQLWSWAVEWKSHGSQRCIDVWLIKPSHTYIHTHTHTHHHTPPHTTTPHYTPPHTTTHHYTPPHTTTHLYTTSTPHHTPPNTTTPPPHTTTPPPQTSTHTHLEGHNDAQTCNVSLHHQLLIILFKRSRKHWFTQGWWITKVRLVEHTGRTQNICPHIQSTS